jgi:enolase
MGSIQKIRALEIFDSRGLPTLKTYVELSDGIVGWAAIPSGASTGSHEAHELRDKDPKRLLGKGVLQAKHNVEVILNDLLKNRDPADQETIDRLMIKADATTNKSKLGANAILSVSLAVARAAAQSQKKELYQYLAEMFQTNSITMPVPMINVINGGQHANWSTDFQEYMIVPHGFENFSEALRASAEVFQQLKKNLHQNKQATTVGDEGGFAPRFNNNQEPLDLLVEAIEQANYVPGAEIAISLDIAANEFYQKSKYLLKTEQKEFSSDQLIAYYLKLKDEYPIYSFEDPLAEDDWQGFAKLMQEIGEKTQIVGDDLYVTNPSRFRQGIELKTTNAILVKLNQIGTLSETIEVLNMAKENGQQTIISHRSGETEDTFIADLAIASAAGQIKTGSLSRSERLAKYNRLLEIEAREKELNPKHLLYYSFPYKPNGNGY